MSRQQAVTLGSLVPQMFDTQQISFTCELCRAESATMHRAISKLPNVLVLCLKRFSCRPTHGYNKNRNLVTIDETLEFTQFCSPEAFSMAGPVPAYTTHSDEDRLHDHPQIPSDSFPSSSSSRFSSASPVQHDHFWNFSPPLSLEDDYIDLDHYDPLRLNSAADPIILISDDEDETVTPANESLSFFDEPSEEEQYKWAVEESLRASQTESQDSALKAAHEDTPNEASAGILRVRSCIFDPADPGVKGIRLSTKSGQHDIDTSNAELESEADIKGAESEDRNEATKVRKEDDEDDEDLKAAIEASLMAADARSLTEEELRQQENREVQEAISKSLKDQEDNKENISPEQKRRGKKEKKGKNLAVLTRSCTQSEFSDPTSFKGGRHSQLRANTVDTNGRMSSGKQDGDLSSQSSSQSQPAQYRRPTRSSSFASGLEVGTITGEQSCLRSSGSPEELDAADFARASRTAKGKDKAPKKTEVHINDTENLGLFQLQATVSHTGLISTTSEGYYVCDRLGADGVWRCQDGSRRTKLGSISDLNKHRGRSGYLFFYVRRRVEGPLVL
ncbi:hypothetical protein BGX28_001634 [Mortierella sp. GBA30]|nr:hypothetical protein BGX28_001634 [Mortierella sp. GBA30]